MLKYQNVYGLLKHLTMSVVVFALLNAYSSIALSQEKPQTLVQIYDVPGPMMFIQSTKSNRQHIKSFLKDFMGSDSLLHWVPKYPQEVSQTKPIVYYALDGKFQAVELPYDSRESILNLAKSKTDVQPGKPFLIGEKICTDLTIFPAKKPCYGMVHGNQLIAVSSGLDKEPVLDEEVFNRFKGAKRLNDSLDPKMLALLSRASMGAIARPDDTAPFLSEWFNGPLVDQTYTPEEKKLIKKLDLATQDASIGAAGLTYANRQLNAEFHLKFSKKDSFDGILDFENADESSFQPTVGLSTKELLASFSLQNSIFASAEVGRLFQKTMHPSFGNLVPIGSDSSLFRLTGGLVADSWKDITGARVAIYNPRPDVLSVVSIIDAKEPEEFFSEVEKLVAIVEPVEGSGPSELASKELDRLIQNLGSREYSLRQRAQTRLEIAGKRALPALKKAIKESDSAEVRMRSTGIVKRLEQLSSTPREKVSNLNFWANLDPELAIVKGADELFGFPSRRIKIQLPKELTDEQKSDANQQLRRLFGENWDRVEVIRVGDRFVIMFGYDEALLTETLENLKGGKDPVGKLAATDAPWFQEGNLQLHVSFQRFRKLFVPKDSGRFWNFGVEHPESSLLTSLSLSLVPDYWQMTFNIPVEEIQPFNDCGYFFRKH